MTDPPVVGDIGLLVARRFGVPLLVISQDVFPEIAERVKRLENPLVLGALRRLVALYLRRADRVVAIGETMKLRLEEKGAPAERVAVIPNWVDTTELLPAAAAERVVARSRASTTRSSSCTRATSATPRTSTRSSARRRSSATSSGSRSW